MAFDEVSFPLKAGYGSGGGPAFLTEIVTIEGGYERRNQMWSQARRKYDARTGVRTKAEAALLVSFFQARAGRANGFRLKDWRDYSSALDGVSAPSASDQALGTGDGVTTQFQLVKNYGGATPRPIRKPVLESVVIAVNGKQMTEGWSVNAATGVVSFADAPAMGATLTSGFTFDVPVRFDVDQLILTNEDEKLFQAEIPLIEIRV